MSTDARIDHGSADRSIDKRRVETVAPRILTTDDRMLLLVARQILSTRIDSEVAELARDLDIERGISLVGIVPRGRTVGQRVGLRQTTTAIEGEGGIKLPKPQARLVACRKQAFVATLQRFGAQHTTIGGPHEVVAVGGREVETLDGRDAGIHLEGMGVATTIQVGDRDGLRIAIVVDDGLVEKMGIEILRIDLQRLISDGNHKGRADAIVPSLLLAQFADHELAAACHDIVALSQDVRRAVALARRQAKRDHIVHHPLHMSARREERAIDVAMIDTETRHSHETLVEVERILRIGTGDGLSFDHRLSGERRIVDEAHILMEVVVVEAQTGREIVLMAEVGLKNQRGVGILLVDVIDFQSVARLLLVHGDVAHQGDTALLLVLEDVGVLHRSLVAIGLNIYFIQRLTMGIGVAFHLSRVAVLLECSDAAMEDILTRTSPPAILDVVLSHLRIVLESIAIAIMMIPIVLKVGQQLGGAVLIAIDMEIGHRIGLKLTHAAAIEIELHLLLVLRLQILDVDLSRHGLVAVLDGGVALRHLDAVHPRPRDVAQGKGSSRTAEVGQQLGQHLHIGAAEAQELDLLRSRGSVRIVDIHGRVVDETLAEVAASGLEELALEHRLAVDGTTHRADGLSLGDRHLVDMLVGQHHLGRIRSDGDGIYGARRPTLGMDKRGQQQGGCRNDALILTLSVIHFS